MPAQVIPAYGEIPFGLRDARVTPWVGAVLSTTSIVDLPRIRSLEANITFDSADLEGDDVRLATHTFGTAIEGSIESGGINGIINAIFTGGSYAAVANVGTYILEGDDVAGYFKMESQAFSDDAGDVKITIWKAKCTNGPNWTFNQGEFVLTNADVTGVFDASVTPSRLVSVVQAQTVTALTAPIYP